MTAGQCSDGHQSEDVADDTDIPKGRIRRTAQVGSVVGSQGARYAGTRARNLARDPRRRRAGARAAPSRGRRADGRDARAHEGRRDEDRAARLVHRHGVPAAGVPRPLPGQARDAPLHGAADAVGEGRRRCSTRSGRSRVEELFEDFEHDAAAAASIGQVHRAVLPDGRQGGREGPVPRRGGRDRRRHAERRPDPAAGQGVRARARREGGRGGAEGARDGGARLRARGAVAARLRARLPAPPVHPRAGRGHAAVDRAGARERVGRRRRLRRGARAPAGRARPLRRDRVPLLLRLDLPPPALQRRRPSRATTWRCPTAAWRSSTSG